MFDKFIKYLTNYKEFTGLKLPKQEDLDKLTKFDEVVASASPVVWKQLDLNKLPSWPVYNQFYTYSCVANTRALMKSILYYKRTGQEIKFSPIWTYDHRLNKPGEGMIGTDSFRIDEAVGGIPYDLLPTPQSEMVANNPILFPWFDDVGKIFQTADKPILVPIKNIDTLVSIQQATDKPIMVWFDFQWNDWAQFVPEVSDFAPLRHSCTFVPPKNNGEMTWGMYQGEKAIVIQDSTGIESTQKGLRIITESFFKKRNIFVAYDLRFKFDAQVIKPHYDGTIISAQKCLQFEGYFPSNATYAETIGPLTKKALGQFQTMHSLPVTNSLDQLTKNLLGTLYL